MSTEENLDPNYCSREEFMRLLEPLLEPPRHEEGDEKGELVKDHNGNTLPSPIEKMALQIYHKPLTGLWENARNHFDHVDIYQSTILHMFEKDPIKFKPGTNLKGFMYTSMARKWSNLCDRKMGKVTTPIPEPGSGRELPTQDPSVEDDIDKEKYWDAVKKCLDKITPPERREALEHRIGGLKLQEIATLMGKPIGTVTTWINDAKEIFKPCIMAAGVLG